MKQVSPKSPRSGAALIAILHCKGGAMKDRRLKRAKDRKNSWRSEEHV